MSSRPSSSAPDGRPCRAPRRPPMGRCAIDAALAKSYNEQVLFSMAGITPESVLRFADMGYDFPEDGLYVTEAFYKKYPEQCRRFAEASRKG